MSPCIPQSVGGNVESNVGARKFSAVLSEIIRVNDTEYMVIKEKVARESDGRNEPETERGTGDGV